jgi:glycosyltransferase 2 family protein
MAPPTFESRQLRRAEATAIAAAAASLALLAAGAAWAGAEKVLQQLGGISAQALLGLLVLSLLNYTLRALRWHLFSRHLGLRVPLRRSGLYYLAGFAATTTPGKVGEALRLWFLERADGCRYERTAALLVGDRLSDLTATVLLCLLGVSTFASYLWTTVALAVLLGGMIGLFMRPAALLRFLALGYGWVGRWPRLFARVRVALRQTARLFGPRVYAAGLVLATIGWLAEGLALYWLLTLLGADVSLREAVFVFAFAMIVGGLSMLPGGLGGTEATMVALLLALSVGAEVAVAATAMIRVTTLWFAIGLGFLALPWALRLARLGRPASAAPVGAV